MNAELSPSFPARPSRHAVCMRCEVVREEEFKLLGFRILDVSETGMLVASDADVSPGETLLVSFRVPFSRRWIDADAVVTRVARGRRRTDRSRRAFGVRFQNVSNEAMHELRDGLLDLPAPPAGRGAGPVLTPCPVQSVETG